MTIADHEVPVGFEEDPFRALPARLDGLDDLHHLRIGFHALVSAPGGKT